MIDYLISSLILLCIGVAFNVYPAKKPHGKYGYRSRAALATTANWEKAQRLARRYFIIGGVVTLLFSLYLFYSFPGNGARLVCVLAPVATLVLIIVIVEKKLKE